jgi:hypothetical protein
MNPANRIRLAMVDDSPDVLRMIERRVQQCEDIEVVSQDTTPATLIEDLRRPGVMAILDQIAARVHE